MNMYYVHIDQPMIFTTARKAIEYLIGCNIEGLTVYVGIDDHERPINDITMATMIKMANTGVLSIYDGHHCYAIEKVSVNWTHD